MTVRTPLYLNGGNLQEMTTTQIDEIKSQVRYLYATDPSVDLSVVSSGGSLGTISDTRKTAGASSTDVTNAPTEEETDEPGTVTVNYSRIDQSAEDTAETADTSNIAFPVYNNGGNIQAMTLTDMYDTFIYSEIDTIADGNDRPGTYRIHTSNSLSGQTLISSTPVFSDTRANTGAYTAAGIPEAVDQPFTVTNYYLFRVNAGSAISYSSPVFIRSDNNLQEYSTASFDAILKNCVRHVAAEVTGSRIRYRINGDGNNRGSGMSNTILNGSGNYQTRYVNTDDYRAQEFPDGTAVTASTNYLKIYQV
jgi:hypothetical protein